MPVQAMWSLEVRGLRLECLNQQTRWRGLRRNFWDALLIERRTSVRQRTDQRLQPCDPKAGAARLLAPLERLAKRSEGSEFPPTQM
jgi:hypothetical protein